MIDLNIDVVNNNNKKKSVKEDEGSTDELSGTSSASSLVNADESPITGAGVYDFFSNDAVSPLELFPMSDDVRRGDVEVVRVGSSYSGCRSSGSNNNQWLNLGVLGSGTGIGTGMGTDTETKAENGRKEVKRSRRGPRSRSSQYRGVTFYRRTGRWESHIWDCGKQVYLGGFDTAHAAARAYDRAAIKFRGVDADINFSIADYDEDMKQMKNLTKEEFVQILRRQSSGFSRGSSRYRGVTLNKCGRWEARMGQFPGKKAYDKAVIPCNGREAVTNFEPSSYESRIPITQVNNEGDGQNLDLNLGISITIDGPKGSHNMGVGESQLQHPALHFANGKWPVNGSSAYFTSGTTPLYGQPLASRQSTPMWSGLPTGRSAIYEHDKVGNPNLDSSIAPSERLPHWPWYMQNQGQGESSGGGVGTANQVPLSSNAASSGFSSFSTTAPSSTPHPLTNFQADFHNHGRGR